jgi:tRNA uridine 5-carbamoylmethylation protein Kti12
MNSSCSTGTANEPTDAFVAVIVLCGLPASGKSCLAKRLQQHLQSNADDQEEDDRLELSPTPKRKRSLCSTCHLIEYDAVQESLLADDSIADDELKAWRKTRQVALQSLQDVLAKRKDEAMSSVVLLDDNFHLSSMRKQIYQTCQRAVAAKADSTNLSLYFGIVHVDTPAAVCLQRNRQRARAVPDKVISNMASTLEPPLTSSTSSYWEQTVLAVNGVSSNVDHAMHQVLAFVETLSQSTAPVPPPIDPAVEQERLRAERQSTASSMTHSLDQQLRQLVGIVARFRPEAAAFANQMRRVALSGLKNCNTDQDTSEDITSEDITREDITSEAAASEPKQQSNCRIFIDSILLWHWTPDERVALEAQLMAAIES